MRYDRDHVIALDALERMGREENQPVDEPARRGKGKPPVRRGRLLGIMSYVWRLGRKPSPQG